MKKEDWVWMPHPAHFICAQDCNFHLATCVGNFIVSTVGEYFPPDGVREIIAKSRGVTLKGIGDERRHSYMTQIGYEDIGYNRKYETMVFPAMNVGGCCPYRPADHCEKDMVGYNDPESAFKGHMELCEKWSRE